MALFPIYGYFKGDYIPRLVAVDTDDTFAEVAGKVAEHTVGRTLPADPRAKGYTVTIDSETMDPAETLGVRVAAQKILPLHWVDVNFAY
jgi:toluene monooxygenase system protein B